MKSNPIKKTYSFDVTECSECPFFTFKWKVYEKHQIRNRATIPCYVCEHPYTYMLQLPNVILVEGKPVNIKEQRRTWEWPSPDGVPIPKWCKLDDPIDPGVRTGVTGIIVRDGKVLLGLRGDDCQTARNEWAYPGGRMDYGQSPIENLVREIYEETDMEAERDDIEFLTWMNEFFPDDEKHYISLVFFVKKSKGDPVLTEPDKCKEWRWFDPDDLPENTFWACKKNIEKYKDKIKNG